MKILVVEDTEEELYLLETMLKEGGYQVVSAGNGVEALRKLREESIDFIISDILMPKMDGFQLCTECKQDKDLKEIPFVFYTATYTDKKDMEFALSLGAEMFIIKPMEPDLFLKTIKESIRKFVKGELLPSLTPQMNNTVYLNEYNEILVKKLEKKMKDLEIAHKELKKSETEYKNLSLDLNTILDAIDEPLIKLSPELKVIWANRGASELFGVKQADMTGQYCYKLWLGNSQPCEGCPTLKCFQSGKRGFIHIATRDDRFWDVKVFPVKDEKNKVNSVIAVALDKTAELLFQTESVRAGQLAELGVMAASVAHEINNPIFGIISCAQILLEVPHINKDIVNRIIGESERIADVVRGFLSFSREEEVDKGYFSIQELLSDILMLTTAQMRKDGIEVKMDVSPDLPYIYVYPQRIQQVFLNLINNSRYALNEKYPDVHKDKIIEITCKAVTIDDYPYIQVTVEDHGTGIPADKIDKVSNPFFTTKPRGKGTGLGLSIIRNIIDEHGGKMTLDSVYGEYTKAVFTLPLVKN